MSRIMASVVFLLVCSLGIQASGICPPRIPAEQKLKVEELISRHLDSIGTDQARDAIKNRLVEARVDMIFRLGNSKGRFSGAAELVSQAPMSRFAMNFGREDYPGEQIVCDGNKVSEAMLRPNVRADLTKLVHEYDFLVKEGLLNGAASLTWPFLKTRDSQMKLDYRGIKKIDGRQLHELRVRPRGSGNWDIFLYFEDDTFRHVLSLYQLKLQPFLSRNIDESARQADAYWRLREEFGDFQISDGVSVPHSYKLVLTYDSPDRPFITEWDFAVTRVRHNQELNSEVFTIR